MKKNDDDILLWLIIILVLASVCSCKPKPQFYINEKPYYTTKGECLKEELKWQPYGPKFAMECVKWKIDTVEIKEDTREWPR